MLNIKFDILYKIIKGLIYFGIYITLSYAIAYLLTLFISRTQPVDQLIFKSEFATFAAYSLLLVLILIICKRIEYFKLPFNIFKLRRTKGSLFTAIAAIAIFITNDPIRRYSELLYHIPISIHSTPTTPLSKANILVIFYTIIIVPLLEELVFRHFILREFIAKKEYWIWGLFISSLLFGVIHQPFYRTLEAFLTGIVIGTVFIRYGLRHVILFHILYNILWSIVKIAPNTYWYILKLLDFGFCYFTIVGFSVVFLIFYVIRNLRMSTTTSYARA